MNKSKATFCASIVAALLGNAPTLYADSIAGLLTVDGVTVTWEAAHNIVTTVAPDSPAYIPIHGSFPGYSGVAGLIVGRPGGSALCTGSLISAFQVVTAAHCLTDSAGAIVATSVTSVFFPDEGGQYIDGTTSFLVHPDYTGSVFDDHDIAVVNLGSPAPGYLDRYRPFYGNVTGDLFQFVGYGGRGEGNTGNTIPAGTRLRGFNEFDALGASLLPFLGVTSANSVYLFDFDNGLPANDAFGYWLGIDGLGLGQFESMTAGGDSGGPSFVNGRLAALTSFGLTLTGTNPTTGEILTSDILPGLNSSFGEFAGNTSIKANRQWLRSVITPVPEPGTLVLVGVGLLVAAARRRLA